MKWTGFVTCNLTQSVQQAKVLTEINWIGENPQDFSEFIVLLL